jgi:galactokinase
LLCAIILAAADLAGSPLSAEQVASLAQRAETEWVGVPVGIMDPLASMCGAEDHALFLDCRTGDHEQVALHRSTPARRLSFLIVDTKVSRRLVEGGYAGRRRSCEEAAGLLGVAALRDVTPEMLETHRHLLDDTHLRRARHVVTENARVLHTVRLLRERGLEAIGHLLGESHRSLADDYEVSVPELDLAVAAAVDAGALGARMTGAGFGGCAIALVAEESIDSVTSAVKRAFAEAGFAPPSLFEAWPGPGAHRVL